MMFCFEYLCILLVQSSPFHLIYKLKYNSGDLVNLWLFVCTSSHVDNLFVFLSQSMASCILKEFSAINLLLLNLLPITKAELIINYIDGDRKGRTPWKHSSNLQLEKVHICKCGFYSLRGIEYILQSGCFAKSSEGYLWLNKFRVCLKRNVDETPFHSGRSFNLWESSQGTRRGCGFHSIHPKTPALRKYKFNMAIKQRKCLPQGFRSWISINKLENSAGSALLLLCFIFYISPKESIE